MKVSDKQVAAIISLDGPKRYSHFIKMAADQNKVWGLYSNGWALASTDIGEQVFPIWPAKEYAELCVGNDWADHFPKEISLNSFFEELLPSLRANQTLLGIFPTPEDKGVTPNLKVIEEDLLSELARL